MFICSYKDEAGATDVATEENTDFAVCNLTDVTYGKVD